MFCKKNVYARICLLCIVVRSKSIKLDTGSNISGHMPIIEFVSLSLYTCLSDSVC